MHSHPTRKCSEAGGAYQPERDGHISVAVTTHNRARFLSDCLSSILGQLLVPRSIIVSDDASRDSTPAVVAGFEARTAAKGIDLHYYRHERALGQEANRRFAAQHTDAPLVAFLDDDDVWDAEFLLRTAEVLAAQADVSVVATTADVIDADGRFSPELTARRDAVTLRETLHPGLQFDWLEHHVTAPHFMLGNVLTRRSALEEVGFIPTGSGLACDFAVFCALATAGHRAFWIPQRLFHYRVHPYGRASDDTSVPATRAEWCYRFAETVADGTVRRLLLRGGAIGNRAVMLMCAHKGDARSTVREFARLVGQTGLSEVNWRECAVAAAMLCGIGRPRNGGGVA